MNFVGSVWVNGLIMAKELVAITNVTVMIQVNQPKDKRKHKKLKES
jgi:hypothetical protein